MTPPSDSQSAGAEMRRLTAACAALHLLYRDGQDGEQAVKTAAKLGDMLLAELASQTKASHAANTAGAGFESSRRNSSADGAPGPGVSDAGHSNTGLYGKISVPFPSEGRSDAPAPLSPPAPGAQFHAAHDIKAGEVGEVHAGPREGCGKCERASEPRWQICGVDTGGDGIVECSRCRWTPTFDSPPARWAHEAACWPSPTRPPSREDAEMFDDGSGGNTLLIEVTAHNVVRFWIGCQGFTVLDDSDGREHALWMASMLRKAFRRLTGQDIKPTVTAEGDPEEPRPATAPDSGARAMREDRLDADGGDDSDPSWDAGFEAGWDKGYHRGRREERQAAAPAAAATREGDMEPPPSTALVDRRCPGPWLSLWDAIQEYAQACGGNTSARNTSTRRMQAVAKIERGFEALVEDSLRTRPTPRDGALVEALDNCVANLRLYGVKVQGRRESFHLEPCLAGALEFAENALAAHRAAPQERAEARGEEQDGTHPGVVDAAVVSATNPPTETMVANAGSTPALGSSSSSPSPSTEDAQARHSTTAPASTDALVRELCEALEDEMTRKMFTTGWFHPAYERAGDAIKAIYDAARTLAPQRGEEGNG